MFKKLIEWLKNLFGGDPAPEPTPTPEPVPVPVDPVDPVPPDPGPTPEPTPPPPDVTPVPPPAPPSEGFAVDLFVDGEEIGYGTNENGVPIPEKLVVRGRVGDRIRVKLEILMEQVGDPALYAQLVETQAFRDNAFIPGAALLQLVAWPYTNPRFYINDLVIKGVGINSGQPAGWVRVLNNTATQKDVYLANIAREPLRVTIEATLTVRREGASYGLIRGWIDAAYGDTRKRNFELWLNNVEDDL